MNSPARPKKQLMPKSMSLIESMTDLHLRINPTAQGSRLLGRSLKIPKRFNPLALLQPLPLVPSRIWALARNC